MMSYDSICHGMGIKLFVFLQSKSNFKYQKMCNNTITNPLGMSKEEVDALVGKQVYLELRKPDPVCGMVTKVKECLGDVGRSGIYVNGVLVGLGNIESLKIINNL